MSIRTFRNVQRVLKMIFLNHHQKNVYLNRNNFAKFNPKNHCLTKGFTNCKAVKKLNKLNSKLYQFQFIKLKQFQ